MLQRTILRSTGLMSTTQLMPHYSAERVLHGICRALRNCARYIKTVLQSMKVIKKYASLAILMPRKSLFFLIGRRHSIPTRRCIPTTTTHGLCFSKPAN